MKRTTLALLLAAVLLGAGCRGAVTARGMKALGPWSERDVSLEPATPGEDEAVSWARVGALEAMKKAGLEVAKEPGPGALVVRVREIGADEGRATLLSSPSEFVADKAKVAAMVGAKVVGEASKSETVKDAAGLVVLGVGGAELVEQAAKVRVALELFAPDREPPLGGVVWEGWRRLDRNGEAETAGREAGAVLAEEIASQRDRWVDRRPASERLFRTPTPLLLEKGEAVVSLDQGLLLHAGYGVKRWLQLDAAAGGWIAPTANGFVQSRWDGATVVGVASIGAKVRLAEEGPIRPGIAASLERLTLWSGAIGSGRVAVLDKTVDTSSPEASSGLSFNLLTLALSKHPTEWLQVGAGGTFVAHGLFGAPEPLVHEDGTAARSFVQLVPYLNVEARAGEHFRFIGELMYPGGFTVGLRTLLYGSRHFGELRTAGWRVRLDTAALITSRDAKNDPELAVLPWIGVALYPR